MPFNLKKGIAAKIIHVAKIVNIQARNVLYLEFKVTLCGFILYMMYYKLIVFKS